VPNGYDPPPLSGSQTLPPELFTHAVAQVIADRPPIYRTIEFSGFTWKVKASETLAGPGPNYFSDSLSDVWVDAGGRLHLRIVYQNNRWYCTEIFCCAHGLQDLHLYAWQSSRLINPDDVVLGLFTWDDTSPDYSHREIDIEFSRWGEVTRRQCAVCRSTLDNRRQPPSLQHDFAEQWVNPFF
jgi:hypothetical protein